MYEVVIHSQCITCSSKLHDVTTQTADCNGEVIKNKNTDVLRLRKYSAKGKGCCDCKVKLRKYSKYNKHLGAFR